MATKRLFMCDKEKQKVKCLRPCTVGQSATKKKKDAFPKKNFIDKNVKSRASLLIVFNPLYSGSP